MEEGGTSCSQTLTIISVYQIGAFLQDVQGMNYILPDRNLSIFVFFLCGNPTFIIFQIRRDIINKNNQHRITSENTESKKLINYFSLSIEEYI